jgi:putative spermidine/putrescine transport system permease protein
MGRRRWSKWLLAGYFLLFLLFLYGPILVITILSFQSEQGRLTFPLEGFSFHWWRTLFDTGILGGHAEVIRETGLRSLYLGLGVGAVASLLAFSLSMAFRRRFRADGVLFYFVMLCLMTPGFLLSLGTSLFWQTMGIDPSIWKTGLGTNVIWALPFGFLVMVAVWNRYDRRVEEAARDLGADAKTTFREVTLPLIWTGILGAFLFGFTLSWNDYDRTALVLGAGQNTLPISIFGFTTGSVLRPDLYALGTATTIVSLLAVGLLVVVTAFRLRRRGAAVAAEAQAKEELGEVVGGDVGGSAGAAPRAQ